MALMDGLSGFMAVLKEAIGLPVVVKETISEGVSDGVAEGISRNRDWIERDAVKFVLFLVGSLFFCWGLVEIGDTIVPQYKGLTALFIGLLAGLAIALLSTKN